MDPSLAAPIATLTGAVATAILMWASYNFPRGYHRSDAEKNEDDEEDEHRADEDTKKRSRREVEDRDTSSRRMREDRNKNQRRVDNSQDDYEADLD